MNKSETTKRAEEYLQLEEIHDRWSAGYRTAENQAFYDLAFSTLAEEYFPPDAHVLDVGCGTGDHTARLAGGGHRVTGMDLSLVALNRAATRFAGNGTRAHVTFVAGSVLDLPFRDNSVPVVVAWGVLMHVPDVTRAWRELARVTAPGGVVIVSEANRQSVQSMFFRGLRRILRPASPRPVRTDIGDEYWVDDQKGTLVTREADVAANIAVACAAGLQLVDRRAGQLTEAYTRLRWEAPRKLVHAANRFWFTQVKRPGPAFGNLVVMQKPALPASGASSGSADAHSRSARH